MSVPKGWLVSYSCNSQLECHIIQENHDIKVIIFQHFVQEDNCKNRE